MVNRYLRTWIYQWAGNSFRTVWVLQPATLGSSCTHQPADTSWRHLRPHSQPCQELAHPSAVWQQPWHPQSWLTLSAGWHQLWEFSAPQSAILGLALLTNGPPLALGQWSQKCDLSLPSNKAATGPELPGNADNCVKTLHTFQQPQVSTLGRAWQPTRPGASQAYQHTHSSQPTLTEELLEPHRERPWSIQLGWPEGNILLGLIGDFVSFLKNLFIFLLKGNSLQNFAVFCQALTWISHRYPVPSLHGK